jgi:flagellar motor switch protein FliG
MNHQRNSKNMASPEKAALILLALGEDLAAQIMNSMDRDEVVRIAQALQKTGRVEQKTLDEVLVEFHDMIVSLQKTPLGNATQFLSSIEKNLGPEVAAMLHRELDWATPSLQKTLEKIEVKPLSGYLQKEHPQTAAIVMAHLPPQKAGQILRLMPEASWVEMIQRLARLGPVVPETINALEEALKDSLSGNLGRLGSMQNTLGGAQKVADLLSQLDRGAASQLLGQLKERDQKLHQEVQEKLFRFVNLVQLESKDLLKILQVIPQKTLLIALKDCPAVVLESFQKAMSQRAWRQMQEDLKLLPPVRLSEVEKAQHEILKTVRAQIDSGEIELRDPRDTYV